MHRLIQTATGHFQSNCHSVSTNTRLCLEYQSVFSVKLKAPHFRFCRLLKPIGCVAVLFPGRASCVIGRYWNVAGTVVGPSAVALQALPGPTILLVMSQTYISALAKVPSLKTLKPCIKFLPGSHFLLVMSQTYISTFTKVQTHPNASF